MNSRDMILQKLTPVIAVPRFEDLDPGDHVTGHRFLVAEDGLWIEADLPWLYARAPLAISPTALPFGALNPEVRLKCVPIPRGLLREFAKSAREASPREIAAIITWHEVSREFSLLPVTRDSGNAHVRWERPRSSFPRSIRSALLGPGRSRRRRRDQVLRRDRRLRQARAAARRAPLLAWRLHLDFRRFHDR